MIALVPDPMLVRRLMSRASYSPGYRRPMSLDWVRGFVRVCEAFLSDVDLPGQRIVDLGAGHFHLSALLSQIGAMVVGVERDPALASLGSYLGFPSICADFRNVTATDIEGEVDGIFSKFAVWGGWYQTESSLIELCEQLRGLMKPDAWGWFSPWNGVTGDLTATELGELVVVQHQVFSRYGWEAHELSPDEAGAFGISTVTASKVVYIKNLIRRFPSVQRWKFDIYDPSVLSSVTLQRHT